MAKAPLSLPVVRGFGETSRRDAWWVQPLVVFLVLAGFVGYATFRAFEGIAYRHGPYLSPFFSPEIFGDPRHAWFGPMPGWLPLWFSPALLILPFPAGFRFTCYYYRGAYYKAFWGDPPSCAVGEPRKSYWGENSFPLILQNVHRYFLYVALLFLLFLAYDAVESFFFTDPQTGTKRFGIGVGSLVLTLNVILLSGYTLGCHSFRHLVGGRLDELSKSSVRQKVYDCASCLNRGHMNWAWGSLLWVAFSDLYVRMCSMGIWTDFRLL
ncbi:MAG: hypothetical protein NZO58_11760 [Gemmataceae bacterium]|nr:hypothetical protein [Gemmataceae bacterium]